MPKSRVVSPARSQGHIATTKRKKSRGSRSVCSPALSTASGRLTSLIDQFKDKNRHSFALSPLNSRSVLNDNTDIEEPRRKSWWKKLDENSQAVLEVLEDNKVTDANNLIEKLIDIEVLSQEKKNFTLDLPESSDNESINSIVLPQRKLFTQKENQPQKKFGQLIGNRESLAKLPKTNTTNIDKTINVGARELFQNVKRSKPIFPAALLQMSPNKTAADKTKENLVVEPKPPVRNIFGNRPTNKRKNIFADFIVSESEDEIPDIQPKVFGFQKKLELRRISSVSKGRDTSPTSSITTDIEMDDWKHLPSSTMVENQLEDMVAGHTPIKRARLSKLSEAKESEAGTNTLQTNTTGDKTKQSNKSISSKNKSKSSPETKDKTLDNSRTTRSMAKNTSVKEELHNISRKQGDKGNRSQNIITNNPLDVQPFDEPKDTDKQATLNKSQKQNLSKSRNTTKVIENEMESDENVRAINIETKIIRKSSSKNKSSIIANKSVNEEDIENNDKDNNKMHKSYKTGLNNVGDNQEDDDQHNFALQNEHDRIENEAVMNVSIVLQKDTQKDETNKSKSNKSLPTIQKQAITSEESVESQNEQNTADGNVDGKQDKNYHEGGETDLNQDVTDEQEDAAHENKDDSKENDSYLIENESNKNRENDDEDNESEENHVKVNESNDKANVSQEIENEHKINESHEIQGKSDDEEHNATEIDENQVNASEEVEDMADASDVNENEDEVDVSNVNNDDVNASDEDDEEAIAGEENEEESNASMEDEEEANESKEDEDEANASVEDEEEMNESKEDEDEANASQEVEVNESQEADVNQSQEIEEEANESHVEGDDASDEENNEEIEEDEEEAANESREVSANENQVESEADISVSEEVEQDQQMDDSDEADKAIATDADSSEDDNDEMLVEENEMEPSEEVVEESPDVTHDTTGRNRNKYLNRSPEAILNNRANQMDSFMTKGRNTSARKTKSMIKNLDIRPNLAPPRDSIGFSDGTTNSSAEGSGWDSHRTTRKTLRQTFGKDFTPRKSLRALVMEKSAKRNTEHMDLHSETVKFPQANSTECPEDSTRGVEGIMESDHDVSRGTRLTTLETYLQKIKQENIEKRLKMEEAVRDSLKGPARDPLSLFKVPNKPAPRRPKSTQKKQIKSIIPLDEMPSEMIADMKYKPPKRFRPTNASWITKRLYRFLENKLEPRYDYKARVRAEKLVETIYHFAKDLRRHTTAPPDAVDVLKHEMARLDIVHTHFEFYEFFHEFMPREIRVKVNPDIVNNIPLPRHGVFSEILRGVKG